MNDNTLKKAVAQYGTPLYIYDGAKIQLQYRVLKDSLPREFEIFYSMKANPLLGICRLFKQMGSRIEVASAGELYTALMAGFLPNDIIFTSPGKTVEELEYAIETGIYCINIESLEEARIINELGGANSRRVAIAIRINPDFDISGAGIKMAGVPTQFGIDQSQLKEVFQAVNSLSNVNVIGIHVYTGTQVLNAGNIVANMKEIIKLAVELADTYSFKIKFLDLGGGFGIPYFPGETELDLVAIKQGIAGVWEKYRSFLAETRVAVESGRFLMAESGLFLTKVLYCKENKGRIYLVCDGGSNQHANSAFLGRHIRNNFPLRILGRAGGNDVEVNLAGPLCTPTDLIGQKVTLPQAVPGDIIIIEKSGAYGLANSPVLFLSHPLPAEVLYERDELKILRERGAKEDFLRGQKDFI